MTAWPQLPYGAWKDTIATLHRWTQIVGKYRLAHTPWVNHSWHVPLYVTANGLTTSLIHVDGVGVEIRFDFINHAVKISTSNERYGELDLEPMTVATFDAGFKSLLRDLELPADFHHFPNEVPDPVPFADDEIHGAYDGEAVARFWRALLRVHSVLSRFRTGFIGKVSPVHFFWGSFDLAVTRFSGRPAPPHPGGIPALPDAVTREAYSHEVSSAGFWPGGGGFDEPAFYSYTYPAPAGFDRAPVAPDEAFFSEALAEFLLPYDAVRRAADPDMALLAFLESTYRAAADRAGWDRAALECGLQLPRVPRRVS